MKIIKATLLFVFLSSTLYGQVPAYSLKKVEEKLPIYVSPIAAIDSTRKTLKNPASTDNILVSNYTFRNIIKKDFSKLTGSDNTATVGKFAALNINQNTSAFTFTPYTYTRADLVNHNFKSIISVDFAASVDKSNLLDLKNCRTINLSASVTHIMWARYKFNNKSSKAVENRNKGLSIISSGDYNSLYDDLRDRLKSTYQFTTSSKVAALQHPEFAIDDAGNYTETVKAYLDSVSKYEQIMTKKGWTRKRFGWLKFTASPFAFDNTNYIIKGDAATYNKPIEKAFWIPSFSGSFNFYTASNKGFNYYFSLLVQGVWKDQFTDVGITSEWNKIGPLTDSAFTKEPSKNIYSVDNGTIKRKILPNMSLEAIALLPSSGMIGVGFDASYGLNGVISNKFGNSTGWLRVFQVGVILSFKDKTGESNINIEPYYQSKTFVRYDNKSSNLLGVKFSIPIGRLY